MIINFLLSVLQALWQILEDASVYLLFGFLIAGVLAVLVPRQLFPGWLELARSGQSCGVGARRPAALVLLRACCRRSRSAQGRRGSGRRFVGQVQ